MTEPYDYRNDNHVRARAKNAIPNEGLTWLAVMAAKQHKYAIEYIEQAPVLIIGATCGCRSPNRMNRLERSYIAQRFGRIEGMKLKEAMAEFHLPYPLRKLRSTAIAPSYARAIWDMHSIPSSSLSQAIPDKVSHQKAWLRAIAVAQVRADRRSRSLPIEVRDWLIRRLGGSAPPGGLSCGELVRHAADITDMLLDGRFNPVWTFEEAVNAHARWAADLAKHTALEKFATTYGVSLDHHVDYAPQPNEAMIVGDFEIVPLRSGESLIEEGVVMRHCVPSYMRDLLAASSCIYSIRKDGKRIATLELSSGYAPVAIKQLKGPCNAAVTKIVTQVAQEFVAEVAVKPRAAMDTIKDMFRKNAKL